MTLVENGLHSKNKKKILLRFRRIVFYVSLSASFFFFFLCFIRSFLSLSFSVSHSPSSFSVKVKSCFLLCQYIYEGVYMTRLLVDDKTFKNIRCYYRWCFPLRMCAYFSFFDFLFFQSKNYSTNMQTNEREKERRKTREFQCCCCCCCYFSCVILLFSPWISKRKKNETKSENIYM